METGKHLPTQSNVEVLLGFYGRSGAFPMLRDLLAVAKLKHDPPAAVPSAVVKDFSLAVGLEPYARKIDTFEPTLVIGLLQTEPYARTLIEYHASIKHGMAVDIDVALRMQRQNAVTREEQPVELRWFAEETVFRRLVGGPDVMVDQLNHLLDMLERPNIQIMIVPERVAVHPALSGAFNLLGFDDGWRPYMVGVSRGRSHG